MDTNTWRSNPPGGEPAVDMDDSRAQLPPDSGQRFVNKNLHVGIYQRSLELEGVFLFMKLWNSAEILVINWSIHFVLVYLWKLIYEKPWLEEKKLRLIGKTKSLDSTSQTGHAIGADWQEEVHQKIKAMKETYLPELNEMLQKIAAKCQQNESFPQLPKPEQLEKLKVFKAMLERLITFLQVSKHDIHPHLKEKLGSYEKQIIQFISSNRPRKPTPSLQLGDPGQLLQTQTHSMQKSTISTWQLT